MPLTCPPARADDGHSMLLLSAFQFSLPLRKVGKWGKWGHFGLEFISAGCERATERDDEMTECQRDSEWAARA